MMFWAQKGHVYTKVADDYMSALTAPWKKEDVFFLLFQPSLKLTENRGTRPAGL